MDGLEQAAGSTGTSGGEDACDCFDPTPYGIRLGRDDGCGGIEHFTTLARTVEGEIIPRLLLSHRADTRRLQSPSISVPAHDSEQVEALTSLILREEIEAAEAFLAALKGRGVSAESIMVDLLGPTARRLGEYWLSDDCSFFDVTMGLCKLHQILRDFGREYQADLRINLTFRSLLTPAPGEQHTFGILVVDEFFRRANWDTVVIEDGDPARIVSNVRNEWFSLIGFSMSSAGFEDALTTVIRTVRRVSRNPDIIVMVGGSWFNEDPRRVALVGADISAVDGRCAIVQIRDMLRLADARL